MHSHQTSRLTVYMSSLGNRLNLRHIFRAFVVNMKLGWNQEGNWAPPLIYLMFALIAPIAGVLMLVFMYLVVKGGSTDLSFLNFILTGSTVFLFIRQVLQGAGFAVVEDREHYRVLRYIYIAPVPFAVQIAGRIGVKLVVASLGVIATFAIGHIFLGISFRPDGVLWVWFFGSFTLGLIGLMAIGWTLSSTMLLIDRMGWIWAEGLAGLMFLASGAIIPFTLLPTPFVYFGSLLPTTYWVELWRLSLFGSGSVMALGNVEPALLWIRLVLTSTVWIVVAIAWYYAADRIARRFSRIERETFY